LFLAEAPGPKAVKSGFISRNNPDESAKNFFELNEEAKISRKQTLTWNIVPWYIGSGKRIRPADDDDIKAGLISLEKLLTQILLKLKVVVLVGQKAQRGSNPIQLWRSDVKVFSMWHPSPQCLNRYKNKRLEILNVLKEVADKATK
jgi:uracil-DNA glycosylase